MPATQPNQKWFAPWSWRRRTLGVCSLIGAIVVVGVWIRSELKCDTVFLSAGSWTFRLVSERGYGGLWATGHGNQDPSLKILWTAQLADPAQPYDPMSEVVVPYRIDLPGFHFGCNGTNVFRWNSFAVCCLAYSNAAIFLVIISVLLLRRRETSGGDDVRVEIAP